MVFSPRKGIYNWLEKQTRNDGDRNHGGGTAATGVGGVTEGETGEGTGARLTASLA